MTMAELRAFFALPAVERRILVRAWLYLLIADFALRIAPVETAETILARLSALSRSPGPPPERLAGLVAIAGRHHLRPMPCLPRALALEALLKRQGLQTELLIGVRWEGDRLQAHAWIEHAGAPLGEPEDVARVYLPLAGARRAS